MYDMTYATVYREIHTILRQHWAGRSWHVAVETRTHRREGGGEETDHTWTLWLSDQTCADDSALRAPSAEALVEQVAVRFQRVPLAGRLEAVGAPDTWSARP